MAPAITIQNLSFTYQGSQEPALAGVNLSVTDGQFVAVMGHAGCGKSTLCMCLNALIPRFLRGRVEGKVLVKDRDVARSSIRDMAQLVGLVFQDFESQLVATTVEQELAFGPENYAVPKEELLRRVNKYLALIQLDELRFRQQATLSGGQRQLLAIASVLALETPILVLDEPTTDLDPVHRKEVLSIARQVSLGGRIVIMVEHESEAVVDADQIVLMSAGKIVACDRPDRLLSQVDLMIESGVRPLQLVELFHKLGIPQAPITVDESLAVIRDTGLKVNRTAEPVRVGKTDAILEVLGVSYVYNEGNVKALDHVSLKVGDGEFLALLGKNGSGKSTLAKVLSGLLQPVGGSVLAHGKPIAAMSRSALAQFVGYVYQNPDYQIFAATVYQEVSFGPRNFGVPEDEIKIRVAQALASVELEGYENRDPFGLTRGERQRVAVASILVSRPRVLILDEPTTGMDYQQQRGMMEVLTRLNRAGHTIIVITHSMWVTSEYARRTVVMVDGGIVLDGATPEVFANEEALAGANLKAPPIVELGNRLGVRTMSVNQMVRALSS